MQYELNPNIAVVNSVSTGSYRNSDREGSKPGSRNLPVNLKGEGQGISVEFHIPLPGRNPSIDCKPQ